MRSEHLQSGEMVGVWVVECALGKGGMGSVYRCHNRHTERILAAIKLLDPAIMHYSDARARFVREAEILFTLEHPHIVKVSNVHLDSTPPWLEMEFVEGTSLETRLSRHGALPLRSAHAVATQLLSAVDYLHRSGVCHRDIKPANLVLRSDGQLKLVDFGLALRAGGDRITQHDVPFGTVAYAPPEWARPGALDPRAWDLYASGVVLWEMLTGGVAFRVDPDADARRQAILVMAEKQRQECLDPGPDFGGELRELVRAMTHRDPARRPATAAEVLARLSALDVSAEPAAPRQVEDVNALWRALPSRKKEAPRPPRRAPRALVLLGIVLVGFLATTAVLQWASSPEPAPPEVTAPAPVARPEPRAVVLTAPTAAEGTPLAFELGPHAGSGTGAVRLDGVLPGTHVLRARAGTCPACDTWEGEILVPVGEGPWRLAVALAVPRVPAPRPVPRTSGPVTKAAFSGWLATQPDWERDAAIAAGRADESYLEDGLEGPGPVVDVSWWAAEAYCAGRGGLAPLDQAPTTWEESPRQPLIEWRAAGGRPAWRRFDGATSTVGQWRQGNSFTGFRCRR